MKNLTEKDVKKALEVIKAWEKQKQTSKSGLEWWNKKGFKVTEKGLKVKASNGKTYPAVKGLDKNGNTLTLLATRNGAVYCKQF